MTKLLGNPVMSTKAQLKDLTGVDWNYDRTAKTYTCSPRTPTAVADIDAQLRGLGINTQLVETGDRNRVTVAKDEAEKIRNIEFPPAQTAR